MKDGYEQALKKRRRFNKDNLKLVPFCIRPQAFEIPLDKKRNRRELGLDEDKFTVVVADGGYGIGKIKAICEEVLKRDLPITLIPVCGTNEKLYKYLLSLPETKNVSFKPQGFSDKMLQYIASADLFCGKSGNIIAEPTFFGVPSIITKHATEIERIIAKNYVKQVKCAINLFNPKKIVDKIEGYLTDRTELDKFSANALAIHDNYGAEKTVDLVFDMLCEKYPDLRNN
jgi:UDP-N-acetylglucosamine:LPS N-acetylglucosamine transferase